MPDINSHIDTVAGARFTTTVCDVQNAYHQIPVAKDEEEQMAFVTKKKKKAFPRSG